jgi:hypothetical protein
LTKKTPEKKSLDSKQLNYDFKYLINYAYKLQEEAMNYIRVLNGYKDFVIQ